MDRWRKALGRAHSLMKANRHTVAISALEELVERLEILEAGSVDLPLALAHGYLGECHLQLGRPRRAIVPFDRAAELCEAAGDLNGVIAAIGNLVECYQHLGESSRAERLRRRRAKLVAQLRRPC